MFDQTMLAILLGAGVAVVIGGGLEWVAKCIYNKYRKIRYGKPDSSCYYCQQGFPLMKGGNAHLIGYTKIVICKDRLRELVLQQHNKD